MFHSALCADFGQGPEWYGYGPMLKGRPHGVGGVHTDDRTKDINHEINFIVDDGVLRAAIDAAVIEFTTTTYTVGVHDCVSFTAQLPAVQLPQGARRGEQVRKLQVSLASAPLPAQREGEGRERAGWTSAGGGRGPAGAVLARRNPPRKPPDPPPGRSPMRGRCRRSRRRGLQPTPPAAPNQALATAASMSATERPTRSLASSPTSTASSCL